MSCEICNKIKPRDSFNDVMEYAEVIKLLSEMEKNGEIEPTYMTCPFDRVFGNIEEKVIGFYQRRMFHQVKCTSCGEIYGLVCDVELGDGQLKINNKVFNPNDYVTKD